MRPARIVLDLPQQPEKSWCWRDDWVTGFDSAYGLFAKFGKLNAMNARDLAELFVDRNCGRRTAMLRIPNIDLRSSGLFDLNSIAQSMRLEPEHLKRAFFSDAMTSSSRRSSDVLRWCPRCAHTGFHATVFQLDFLSTCPTHGQAIRSNCPKCGTQIPYRLQPDVFAQPFCCPSCHRDLAPSLRSPSTKSLRLRDSEKHWIVNLTDLLAIEDDMLQIKLELNRQRKQLGVGEVVFSGADWRRVVSEYMGFVVQVLSALGAERSREQFALPFENILITVKRTQLRPPDPNRKKARGRASRAKVQQVRSTAIAPKSSWDAKLTASYTLYAAIRRYLWRHVVRDHQECIVSAARHLWWNMEGERTCSFCPVAEAFLRWRMYWEMCGTPCYLYAPMKKAPFGIVGWLASGAPVCPANWTKDTEQWVCDHVLARAALGSFRDLIDVALHNSSGGKIEWHRQALTGKYDAYWAIAGQDTCASPIRIYEQVRSQYGFSSAVWPMIQFNSAHHQAHRANLERIRR